MRRTLQQGLLHRPLTERLPDIDDRETIAVAHELDAMAQRTLGRSLSIRTVDAGSCNGCELELQALTNAFYDLERFGLRIVASPRHADVLTITGPVTANMRQALERTYHAMPHPKWIVAVGDCARNGGVFAESPLCAGGADAVLKVDVWIAGCPPTPLSLLRGLLTLFDQKHRRK